MRAMAAAVVLAVVCACVAFSRATNPVIGILTQEDPIYLAASYVKYLESAGARVVPILHTQPINQLTALFGKINGFLIPGGGVDIASKRCTFLYASAWDFGGGVVFVRKGRILGPASALWCCDLVGACAQMPVTPL
jgi:hypothetical protein